MTGYRLPRDIENMTQHPIRSDNNEIKIDVKKNN